MTLAPVPDADGAPFWEYARRGELRVQTCAGCGEPRFPHPPLLPVYAEQAPYTVVVVELDDAPRVRLVGNLVAEAGARLDSVPRERVRTGARVRAVFTEAGLPQWVLERP